MKIVDVNSCSECPFANYHFNAGRIDNCNLGGGQNDDSEYPIFPTTSVLEDCPLKSGDYIFRLSIEP